MRTVHIGGVSSVWRPCSPSRASPRSAFPRPRRTVPRPAGLPAAWSDSDGLPQPEAEVVLARRDRLGALAQLSWRARSGFDGRYEITGVPPGRYLVLVRTIGGDSSAGGRPWPTLFPGVPMTEPGVLVEVMPGLSTEGIDVWLWPYPRRFSVSGRVFGPDGTRVRLPGARVRPPGYPRHRRVDHDRSGWALLDRRRAARSSGRSRARHRRRSRARRRRGHHRGGDAGRRHPHHRSRARGDHGSRDGPTGAVASLPASP